MGFEPVTSRYRCDTLTNWAMKPLTLGAGHLWALMSLWRVDVKWYMKCFIYWTADFQIKWAMIIAVMNAIYKWPAPDVSGFIAPTMLSWWESRTCIARSRVQTPLKSWLFQASIRNCINCVHNCDDHSSLYFVVCFQGIEKYVSDYVTRTLCT